MGFDRYGDSLGPFYDYIWSMHGAESHCFGDGPFETCFAGQFPNYPIWVTEYASTSSDDAGQYGTFRERPC